MTVQDALNEFEGAKVTKRRSAEKKMQNFGNPTQPFQDYEEQGHILLSTVRFC